jgi:hypothetical protein
MVEPASPPELPAPQSGALPTLDEFIEALGGWGVLYAMFLELGGNPKGLPRSAQVWLARRLTEVKAAKAAKE